MLGCPRLLSPTLWRRLSIGNKERSKQAVTWNWSQVQWLPCFVCKEVVENSVAEPSSVLDSHPCQQDLTFPSYGGVAEEMLEARLWKPWKDQRTIFVLYVCSLGFCGGFLEPLLFQINNHNKNIDFNVTRCVISHLQFDHKAYHGLSLVSN